MELFELERKSDPNKIIKKPFKANFCIIFSWLYLKRTFFLPRLFSGDTFLLLFGQEVFQMASIHIRCGVYHKRQIYRTLFLVWLHCEVRGSLASKDWPSPCCLKLQNSNASLHLRQNFAICSTQNSIKIQTKKEIKLEWMLKIFLLCCARFWLEKPATQRLARRDLDKLLDNAFQLRLCC